MLLVGANVCSLQRSRSEHGVAANEMLTCRSSFRANRRCHRTRTRSSAYPRRTCKSCCTAGSGRRMSKRQNPIAKANVTDLCRRDGLRALLAVVRVAVDEVVIHGRHRVRQRSEHAAKLDDEATGLARPLVLRPFLCRSHSNQQSPMSERMIRARANRRIQREDRGAKWRPEERLNDDNDPVAAACRKRAMVSTAQQAGERAYQDREFLGKGTAEGNYR